MHLPVNVDGAIAAISADLGFAHELGNAIFLISRLPGLIAHAHEERSRQSADAPDRSEGSRVRRIGAAQTAGRPEIAYFDCLIENVNPAIVIVPFRFFGRPV